MTNIASTNLTKLLAATAVLAAILFTVGQAEAGTQMPYWKKMQLQSQYTTPPASTNDPIVLVKETEPQDNGDNERVGDNNWPGDMGGGGDNGGKPSAVPTPSAVLGGIAMLGLIAGRRQRRDEDA
ncbi:hypothetical protein [Algisphaera agarilytica]|uniref:PEP-CTERM protein-sorting domain-containing protein n=1 Tax=Algisphaera agarilytica TaxID=1385975 RepID=A0A7X0LKL6_9BACT|nr:hypothetical protein [Algisphaera agarilytica]MBB6429974.1 hypothetical protein [Algisphaera agarilytica]